MYYVSDVQEDGWWSSISNTAKSNNIRVVLKLRNHTQLQNLQRSPGMIALSCLKRNSSKILVSIGYRLLVRVDLLLNARNLGRFYANSEGNVSKTKVAIQVRIIHPPWWVKIMIHSCRTSFGFYIKEESRESSCRQWLSSSCSKIMAIQAISPQYLSWRSW